MAWHTIIWTLMTALNLARYQITQRLHMSLANIILTDKKWTNNFVILTSILKSNFITSITRSFFQWDNHFCALFTLSYRSWIIAIESSHQYNYFTQTKKYLPWFFPRFSQYQVTALSIVQPASFSLNHSLTSFVVKKGSRLGQWDDN